MELTETLAVLIHNECSCYYLVNLIPGSVFIRGIASSNGPETHDHLLDDIFLYLHFHQWLEHYIVS